MGAFSALFDLTSRRHLLELGLGPESACWELGPELGLLPAWIRDQIGTSGTLVVGERVAAADPSAARLELMDIAHARFQFVQMSRLEGVMRAVHSSLSPGGQVLVEGARLVDRLAESASHEYRFDWGTKYE
jgi:hypothetical protein